jgi:hypothetical protein
MSFCFILVIISKYKKKINKNQVFGDINQKINIYNKNDGQQENNTNHTYQ